MAYYWVVTPESPVAEELGLGQGHEDQSLAEAWLTENYPDLLDGGIHEVALYEEGRLVYGPMSLEA